MRNSDERLLAEYVAGDEGALSRLLELHGPGVSRFVRRRLGARRAFAEDATQEVFIRVYRAARSFQGRSAFRTWLFGIALNVCRDYLRKEQCEEAGDVLLATVPDGSLDPLQCLERRERARVVRAAIASLTPAHRLVLRLREHEDLSYDEMAQLLAVPVGTVRSRLHNARAALAEALLGRLASHEVNK